MAVLCMLCMLVALSACTQKLNNQPHLNQKNILTSGTPRDPSITITLPQSESFSTREGQVTIGGTCNAQALQLSTNLLGASFSDSNCADGTWTLGTISLRPGDNVIVVSAQSKEHISVSDSITITYQTDRPQISITSPQPNVESIFLTREKTIQLEGTCGATVTRITTSLNLANEIMTLNCLGSGTWKSNSLPLKENDINNINVEARDVFNQVATASIQIQSDTAPPVVEILGPNAGNAFVTADSTLRVTGQCDPDAQLTTDSGKTFMDSDCADGSFALNPITLVEGVNIVNVYARDVAGNVSTDNLQVRYDPSAPGFTITEPNGGASFFTTQQKHTIRGTCDLEVGSRITVAPAVNFADKDCANDGRWELAQVTLQPGPNEYVFKATNEAGTTVERRITITFDSTPPQLAITTFDAGSSDGTPVIVRTPSHTLAGTCNDDAETLQASVTAAFTDGSCKGDGRWALGSFSVAANTTTVVQITARDRAGNTTTKSLSITHDTLPPSLAITAPNGGMNFTTTNSAVVISGTCSADAKTLASIPVRTFPDSNCADGVWSLGSVPLQPGAQSFQVIATDAAGNTQTDSIQITYQQVFVDTFSTGVFTGTERDSVGGWAQLSADTNNRWPLNASWFNLQNLKTLWHFEELVWSGSSRALDDTANHVDGILEGTANTIPGGKIGRGGTFSRQNRSGLNLGNPIALQINSAVSVSAWVNIRSNRRSIVFSKSDANHGLGYELSFRAGGVNPSPVFSVGASSTTIFSTGTTPEITQGVWHHLVGVYNPGVAVSLYLDGDKVTSNTVNVPTSLFTPSGAIGRMGRATYTILELDPVAGPSPLPEAGHFTGDLDEIAVFNRALTDSDVRSMYLKQFPSATGTFESRVIDGGQVQNWSQFSWTPTAPFQKHLPEGAGSDAEYASGKINMQDNVLFYDFEETSWTGATDDIRDHSGRSNHGTPIGNTAIRSDGKVGQGVQFDGSGDRIRVQNFLTNPTKLTLAAWVRPLGDPPSFWSRIIHKAQGTIGDDFALAYKGAQALGTGLNTSRKIAFIVQNSFGQTVTLVSAASLMPYEGWSFVVATYDSTLSSNQVKIYINGILDNTTNQTGSIMDSGGMIGVGGYIGTGDTNVRDFKGALDEVGIWTRAFTASEILDIYRRGVQRIRFQVRSCDDAACSGETYVGPGGSPSAFFNELLNTRMGVPQFPLSGVVPSNRYFQYRMEMERDDSSGTPRVTDVTVQTSPN